MHTMIAFTLGLILGATIGFITAGITFMNSEDDDDTE